MRIGSLLLLLALSPLQLPAASDRGTVSGRVANPEGVVRIVATSLNTREQFSAAANDAGEFALTSLPPGLYRVIIRNENGTAVTRRYLKVRAGETLRLNARLEKGRPPNPAGTRARFQPDAAASAADLPPVIPQFEESSRDLNAVVLLDDNNGWAVGAPHWDQATRQIKGTIVKTTDGGITWSNQDPGGTDVLNAVFFLNTSQGWAAGDNGTIVRTTDGGAHWTRQPVSTGASFSSVAFADALNGWATTNTPIEYSDFDEDFTDWQAAIWHTTDGGQTWSLQTVPSSATLLKRIVFVNANTGFAAGLKRTGYNAFGDPAFLGAIYGTTDGGRTWNEVFTTSAGLTFTSLYFTDASNGWASGFALSSDYEDAYAFHTSDGGKTWQPQNLNQGEFFAQVRDLHMLDSKRGYAVGTSYVGDGASAWRTLDGGVTWNEVKIQNTNPITVEGYWGLAVAANRVLMVGDRDATSWSAHPWDACAAGVFECSNLLTQAYISPHYMFHDVFFTDRNRGWAAGTRTFSPQLWGQEIFATQDGGQTWTTQFEHGLSDGLFSYQRLESISFADANNGWAAGSSELFMTSSGKYALLGCILHTADGGKTWTDQAANLCQYGVADEFSVIQSLDAQNVWALAAELSFAGTIQMAHTTDGGNHWALVDTGIAGNVAVGFAMVQGGMRFVDAQHGCFGGWDVAGCTSDGGAHWTQSAVDCGDPLCYLNSTGVAFTDALHGWITGGPPDGGLYLTTDGGAHWSWSTPKSMSIGPFQAIQFLNSSTGWLSGNGGLLFQTTDAGAHWTPVATGTGLDLLGLSFPDAQHGWMVGDFGAILSYAGDRTPAGRPAVFTALNAASYASQTSPEAWISIFGANLSATTRSWTGSDFINSKLPTHLDGVSVTVNGSPAYVSYISPTQINAMFPDDGSTGQVSVQVTNSQGSSGTLPAPKAAYSPALFRLSVEQGNYVIAQTSDGKLVGNFMVGYALGTPSQVRPANAGEIVTLYGTGFGPTSPALPSDTLVGAAAPLATAVTFRIGGTVATVKWAGLIASGLYQFNVQVPNVAGGDMVIVAEIAGLRSQGDSVISVNLP
jgi:uncharacterized protein (TIGR03437 family)